jgi:hypothetical protein
LVSLVVTAVEGAEGVLTAALGRGCRGGMLCRVKSETEAKPLFEKSRTTSQSTARETRRKFGTSKAEK